MDSLANLEQQLERTQPKIEGAAEANTKLTSAKDVSPGTTPAETPAEQGRLKAATAGQDQPGATQLEHKLGQAGDAQPSIEASNKPEEQTIGNPENNAQYHHFQKGETCATAAQEGIIHKRTGQDPGLDALKNEARQKGWTAENGGTPPDNVGNLLDAHGIPTQRWKDGAATMSDLDKELSQGHDVIAGVDAGELYQQDSLSGRGHAVWVTGVEKNADGKITKVFVNDSNYPPPSEYDADRFQRAWNEKNRFMVSTK